MLIVPFPTEDTSQMLEGVGVYDFSAGVHHFDIPHYFCVRPLKKTM